MILNPYGEIIQQCYWDLEHKYPNIECCEYVIMPNHFHAIIKIDRDAFRAGKPCPYVVTLGHMYRFHWSFMEDQVFRKMMSEKQSMEESEKLMLEHISVIHM